MAGIYVDTSPLGRVVLSDPDAQTIRARLAQFDPWFASELLVVELRRLGLRKGVLVHAERTLAAVTLVPLTRTLQERASRLDPVDVRSLDAIHLCTALDLHNVGSIGAVLTYDLQLQSGCRHHGIGVKAPV